MKGNSRSEPEKIIQTGTSTQIRWNITRNDRTEFEGGDKVESWDFEFAECKGDSYPELVEGIIRSLYSASDVEALTANYLEGKDTEEFAAFQQFRQLAKAVAGGLHYKDELDALKLNPANDRLGDLEVVTTSVIEILNDKNIL